jgi:hypothetical protein
MSDSLSQWQRLLKNVGNWQGSFTQISPTGQMLADVPTEVALIPENGDRSMRQEVHRYPPGEPAQTKVLSYSSLNRATLFFEDGAFSQGSTQWGPFSEFGCELGLISGERRLRLVQLFNKSGALEQITLIRERLKGSSAPERAQLEVSDWVGTWRGTAITQYADLRPDAQQQTQMTVEQIDSKQVRQTIVLDDHPAITSTGNLQDQRILFTQGTQPVQVLLLPDGASSTCPSQITPRQPLFLEVGWLLDAHTRQRMIRSYDAAGAWVSLTLVTEQKHKR